MTLLQLKQNRNLTFWSLHAMGWSAYAMSQYLGALLYGKGSRIRRSSSSPR